MKGVGQNLSPLGLATPLVEDRPVQGDAHGGGRRPAERCDGFVVLHVEDSDSDALLFKKTLERDNSVEVSRALTMGEATAALLHDPVDCVVLDLGLPDSQGLDGLLRIRECNLRIPIIVLTGAGDEELGLRAVAEGAQDFIPKEELSAGLIKRSLLYAIQRSRVEAQLLHASHHDDLTGLPNRRAFVEACQAALARTSRRRRPAALLFADLDGFKEINDLLGHEAGDRVLVAVSARFRSAVRPGDLLARLGGDEFVFLFEDTDADGARAVSERLLATAREGAGVSAALAPPRLSIGVAITDGREGVERVLQRADGAMYSAKRLGGDTVQIDVEVVGSDVADVGR